MQRRTRIRCAAVLVGAACALGACASGKADRARSGADVAALRGELDELRRAQDAAARERTKLAEELKALDAQQAFLASEAKAAKDDRARVDEALARSDRDLQALRTAVEEARRTPPVAGAAAAAAGPGREQSAEQLYELGMARFRDEQHGQAVLAFGELVAGYPDHALAPSAQYWIAEAYFRQRDFRQALTEFQKVVEAFPRSSQAPEALLKVGLCQRALNDGTAARQSWEAVVKDYPSSSAAAQAQTLLAQLTGATGPAR